MTTLENLGEDLGKSPGVSPEAEQVEPAPRVAVLRRTSILHVAVLVALVIAIPVALFLGRPFLVPIAIALTLQFLLAPFVRLLRRYGIPLPVGSLLVLGGFIVMATGGVYLLSGPAEFWVDELPRILVRGGEQLSLIKEPLEEVSATASQLEEMVDIEDSGQGLRVSESGPAPLETLIGGVWSLALSATVTIVLLYFLLATSDSFLRKLVQNLKHFHQKRITVEVLRGIEQEISRYFLTMCAINLALGLAIGIAMAFLGLPNPALWGAMAGVLNFIPYVGGVVGCAVVTLVALATHDSLPTVALVPTTYVALNGMEGLIFTPALLGRRFALSPVVVFIWFLFWSWIWGIPGALLAIPFLVAVKILCDRAVPLQFLGQMIAR